MSTKYFGWKWTGGRCSASQPVCCRDMSFATQSGTDNEGYSALMTIDGSSITTGHDLPPIVFCPWCGKRISDTLELTENASG